MPRHRVASVLILASMSVLALALAGCSTNRYRAASTRTLPGLVCSDSLSAPQFRELPATTQAYRRERAQPWRSVWVKLNERERRMDDLRHEPNMVLMDAALHERYSLNNARTGLAQAVRWDPTDTASLFTLGMLAAGVGEHQRARGYLLAAWEALDATAEPQVSTMRAAVAAELAWSYRTFGEWGDARTWVTRGHASAPGDPELMLLDGLILAGEGRIDEALTVADCLLAVPYREIIWTGSSGLGQTMARADASGAPARWIRAMAHLHDGYTARAWHVLQPLRWNQPKLPWAHRFWQDVGLVAELSGRDEASLAYALAYTNLPYRSSSFIHGYSRDPMILGEPRRTTPLYVAGRDAFVCGSLFAQASQACVEYLVAPADTGAIPRYRYARDLTTACENRGIWPARARALRGRLDHVAEKGDLGEADLLAASEALAADRQVDGVTEALLGLVSMRRDDFAAARVRLDRAVVAEPKNGVIWSALGIVQSSLGDDAAATASLTRALDLDPSKGSSWFNRGLHRARHDDFAGARVDLEKAAKLSPSDQAPVAVLQQIELAAQRGDTSLPGPASGESGIVFVGAAAGKVDPLLDRGWLMRRYLAEADRAFTPATDADLAAMGQADLLASRYRGAPTPAQRAQLARVYLFLERYEDARALLRVASPTKDLAADELAMLLYAESRLGLDDTALTLMREYAAGRWQVDDGRVWALVTEAALLAGGSTVGGSSGQDPAAATRREAACGRWMEMRFTPAPGK